MDSTCIIYVGLPLNNSTTILKILKHELLKFIYSFHHKYTLLFWLITFNLEMAQKRF